MPMPADLATLFGDRPGQPSEREALELVVIPGGDKAPELCQLMENWTPETHPRNALVQLKADGLRCLYIGGLLVTREGMPFHAAAHALPALRELEAAFGRPMFFDSEYVNEDGLEAAIADMRRGVGAGTVWLFDAVPLEQWQRNVVTAPTSQRIEQLLTYGQRCFGPHLGALMPFRLDADGTLAKLAEVRALGFEGLVIKDAVASYDRGRSSRWQKLKAWETTACRILDVLPGKDPTTGREWCRALLVDHGGRAQRIGSGFTAHTRRWLWSIAAALPGQSADVRHAGTTGGGMLRDATYGGLSNG